MADLIVATQDRYRVGSKSLHVVQQGDLGWVCWLNVEDIDFSGLMLASGETRADCVGKACRVLQTCIDVLERPPSISPSPSTVPSISSSPTRTGRLR